MSGHGRIILELEDEIIVERWFDEEYGINYINVRSGEYYYLRNTKRLFDNYHYTVAYLSKILIDDLRYLRSTHSAKNRVIARLKKFIRVVRLLGFYQYYLEEATKLGELIRVMDSVREDIHRIRDPVHELLYPHLVNILESFMEARIRYYLKDSWGGKAYIEIRYELSRYTGEYSRVIKHVIDTRRSYSSIKLTDKQLDDILDKQRERRERREEQRRLERQFWKFIDGEIFWDPLEDYYEGIPTILEGVN